jgi:hypothetical protein
MKKFGRFLVAAALAATAALAGALPAFAGVGSSPGGPFGR